MKRVVYILDDIENNRKYVLKEEYRGVGIYQEMCPTGYYVHQSWLLVDGANKIQIRSFMNICLAEIMDAIDVSEEEGEYGWKAFLKHGVYIVHGNGDKRI